MSRPGTESITPTLKLHSSGTTLQLLALVASCAYFFSPSVLDRCYRLSIRYPSFRPQVIVGLVVGLLIGILSGYNAVARGRWPSEAR
jgi:hypothetical protein